MKWLGIFLALVASFGVSAGILTVTPSDQSKQGVAISAKATASVDGKAYELITVGSGVRQKRVAIVLNIYVAELMVSDSSQFVRTNEGALSSLDRQAAVAMRLTFLRDVPASRLLEAFHDGFSANGVDAKDAEVVQFLALVTEAGAGEQGSTLTVFFARGADGSESLTYEIDRARPYLKTIKVGAGLARKVMSLWLGEPADSYLAQLKTELLR